MESTPHLKEKFLSTNSPWDFEGGLGTIEPHWVYPKNRFANKSTGCGTIYWWKNYIPSNVSNQNDSNTFTLKTFWDRQFCFYEFFWIFVKKDIFSVLLLYLIDLRHAFLPGSNAWFWPKHMMQIFQKKEKNPKNGYFD